MAKNKLPSTGFFGNFTTDIDDDSSSNLDAPQSKTNENGAEVISQSDVDYEDEDKEEEGQEEEQDYEDSEDNDNSEDSDDEEDPFIATINHLAEKGLISFDEDHVYEEEGEELLEVVFQETLDRRYQEEFIDTIPEEYQSIFKHLQSGRSLDEWVDAVKTTNYDSINMDDESNQKQLIEDHLALTGMDEDDIKEALQEYEDLGTLERHATKAVKYLKKNDDGRAAEYEAELTREIASNTKRQADELNGFRNDVLNTEKLRDFPLPKAKREKLLDHITKPVNRNGESQYVINQKSMENQLLLAYLDMEGYSLKDIKKAVETQVTSGLRQKLTKFTDRNARGSGGSTGRESVESKRLPKGVWDVDTTIED